MTHVFVSILVETNLLHYQSDKGTAQGPDTVTHTYNPSYLGGRDRKIKIQGQSRQKNKKSSKTYLKE
jgi:hypothetical protein